MDSVLRGRSMVRSAASNRPPKALKPTVSKMRDALNSTSGHHVSEIRYSHGAGTYAEFLLSIGLAEVRSDDTVSGDAEDWFPRGLAFTTATVDRASERCLSVRGRDSWRPNPDMGNIIRARTIAMLLGPLIRYGCAYELGLIMDGANWKPGVEAHFGRNLERLFAGSGTTCQAEYCDSRRTPGLQMADLVAGILRDYTITGRRESAFRLLVAHGLHRL